MTREQVSFDELMAEAPYLAIVDAHMPRVNHPRIWIVGGYKGKTAKVLAKVWPHCAIEVWEPQQWAAEEADRACENLARVAVHHKGLGDEALNGTLSMGEWHTDACSMLQEPGQRNWGEGTGEFVDVAMPASNIDGVELTIMNCEGGEFIILPRLRITGLLWKFKWLLIQWHKVYMNDGILREEMHLLNQSHEKIERDGEVGLPDLDDVTWTLWRLR